MVRFRKDRLRTVSFELEYLYSSAPRARPEGLPMRAFVLNGYGAVSDNVRLAEIPDPVAGSGEVLIEIHAASLNPIDFKIVRGDLKRISKYRLPRPFGFDASGT